MAIINEKVDSSSQVFLVLLSSITFFCLTWDGNLQLSDLHSSALHTELQSLKQGWSSTLNVCPKCVIEAQKPVSVCWQLSKFQPHLRWLCTFYLLTSTVLLNLITPIYSYILQALKNLDAHPVYHAQLDLLGFKNCGLFESTFLFLMWKIILIVRVVTWVIFEFLNAGNLELCVIVP